MLLLVQFTLRFWRLNPYSCKLA